MIAFRSKEVSKLETNGTSLVVTTPTPIQPGDVMIAWLYLSATNTTVAIPAGWNLGRHRDVGSGPTIAVYWRLVDGSEPASYTFTLGQAVRAIATVAAYSGLSPTSPVGSLRTVEPGGSSTTLTIPATTAGLDNTWYAVTAGARKSVDPGPTFTIDEGTDAERSDDTTVGGTSGSRPGQAVYDSNGVVTRGAVNDRVVTVTGALNNNMFVAWQTELISDETTGTGPLGYRGAVSGAAQTTNPTPATVNLDASFVQNGDLLIAVTTRLGGSGVTPPAGFTRVMFSPTGSFVHEVYYKIATSEPGTLTWVNGAASGSIYLSVALSAYSGANASSPIGAWGFNQTSGNSAATPTITTRTNGSWILSVICKDSSASGFTSADVLDVKRTEATAQPAIAMFDSNREYAAGSAVSRTLNLPGGPSTAYMRFIAEIRPGVTAPANVVHLEHRETAEAWTSREAVPKAWTAGAEWAEARGKYWDGAAWTNLP